MPFVFIHGVNNRADEDYVRQEVMRNAFLRELVAPVVGIAQDSPIHSPYWGGDGIEFRRNLSVVPDESNTPEKFGADAVVPPSLGSALQSAGKATGDQVQGVIRQTPDLAIDLLWDLASQEARTESDFRELARSYAEAQIRLGEGPAAWLANTTPRDLADDVFQAVRAKGVPETFGGDKLFSMLKEGSKRLAMAIPNCVAGLASNRRRPLTRRLAMFMGDALKYVSERGDGSQPGVITRKVMADIELAANQAAERKEPLVVICHSFGGEIAYDIFTHYARASNLRVDAWVTVGSQVALFEEMSLFLSSSNQRGKAGSGEAITAPACVARWINIVDLSDVLGFLVLPVFTRHDEKSRVEEFRYDTGYPIAGAHSGYFEWPSFYKRLASHLKSKEA